MTQPLTLSTVDLPSKWLTPPRCRWLLALLLLLGTGFHLFYLLHHCPIDLSGDEAQYWDWSRRLGLCYYSKGPLIAYIIRASCALFGDNMPAVRFPALLLSAGSSIVTYLLTRRLFHSDRLALGAVLLNHLVPVFIAGSLLITIDSPLFFCWGLATYFAAIAIFDGKRWAWPLIGVAVGLGALAKYAMLLWLPILGLFLLLEQPSRPLLKTAGPWIACAIALLCLAPCVIWNQQHVWVTLRHVAHQTGAAGGAFSHGSELLLIGSQIGALGPPLAVLMTAAVVGAFRHRQLHRRSGRPKGAPLSAGERVPLRGDRYAEMQPALDDQFNRQAMFLATIGCGFFAFNLLDSLVAKVEPNWPAPAYFTLTILTARFISTKMQSPAWRHWRGWFYATIALGLLFIPIASDTAMLVPIAANLPTHLPALKHFMKDPGDVDPMARLRGWQKLGDFVTDKLNTLRPGAFVLCDDYQQTAEMAFYVHGQPNTYCAGPYSVGKRLSQYDMWPDHRLDRTSPLMGHDAIYVGKGGELPPDLVAAFDFIQPREDLDINVRGVIIHTFKIYRCHGFRGFNAIARHSSSESF